MKVIKSKFKNAVFSLLIIFSQISLSDESLDKSINSHQEEFQNLALKIWDLAEVGYQEYKSSALLQESLESKGFRIQTLPYLSLIHI